MPTDNLVDLHVFSGKKKWWWLLVVMVGGGVLGWQFVPEKWERNMLTPLGLGNLVVKKEKMEVVGFLPTWMIGKTKSYGEEVTQLVFSGIEVTEKGELVWDVQSKKIDNENYLALKKTTRVAGGKNILSIKLFDDKRLESFIKDDEAQDRLIKNVLEVMREKGFEGVNIDFEYMSNPVRILGDDFLSFFEKAKNGGWGEVGVDVFANTIIKGDKDKLKKLEDKVNWVVVMAYDFHRPGSDYAGAVAPIVAESGQRSIREIIDKMAMAEQSPKKFIMAYPLYGYEWVTVDDSYGSAQVDGGYGRTVFYSEGVGITGVKWDEMGMGPWAAWQERIQKSKVKSQKVGKKIVKTTEYYYVDQWHQAYFENQESLEIKVKMAKEAGVGGVGYWALGYEGKTSNLLEVLNSKIKD